MQASQPDQYLPQYRFAPNTVLIEQDDGGVLLRQTPLAVLRLNKALTALLKPGITQKPLLATAATLPLFDQLVTKGFLLRQQTHFAELTPFPKVSVIIPVLNRAQELERCLVSLSQLNYPQDRLELIVVDDGSRDHSRDVAEKAGARVLASGGEALGPAAARNQGADAAAGELLAFLDSDCTASPEWLNELVPAFNDPAITAVGGQVAGLLENSVLDRYESVMSSLSLGNQSRVSTTGQDTFYLPSCNLLIRKDRFLELGGFQAALQVGEDVDLSWRIRDRGWRIAYLPMGTIYHAHRNRIGSFMGRRFFYGTSEALLQQLHPGRKKQMAIPPLLAGLLVLCLSTPLIGPAALLLAFGILLFDSLLIQRKTKKINVQLPLMALLRARVRTLISLLYYLSFHLIRYYLLPMLGLVFLVPKLLPLILLCCGCAVWVDFAVKKPKVLFIEFCSIYVLEQFAYGLGVFWGCLKRRNFSSYTVVVHRHLNAQES